MGIGNWLRGLLGNPLPDSSPVQADLVKHTRDPRVDAAVEVMLSHPQSDQDHMLGLFEGCGFSPLEAWRAYQFLLIGFTHVVLRGSGVTFQTGYDLKCPESLTYTRHRLIDEPFYCAAVASAEAKLLADFTPHHLLPIFGRSAEWNAIQQLAGPDGQLSGVVLTEPLLILPFEGT